MDNQILVPQRSDIVIERHKKFAKENYANLKSESSIFGTITFEVMACDVRLALDFLQAKGALLAEPPKYMLPLRRNSKVLLIFQAKEIGIINTIV